MKIYHLNCGTMHGYGSPSREDTGGFFKRGYGILHCLLVDTGDGLVLVDTGWGRGDCTNPSPMVRRFMKFTHCSADINETAYEQVGRLGYYQEDVRHIILTHLHLDHSGGLPDFPAAQVHIYTPELEAGLHPRTLMERNAYPPEHWAHNPRWKPHTLQGNQFFGLDCTNTIRIGDVEFVMIPMVGHTRGHCCVAVRMNAKWLMHCGDVYGYYRQADPRQPYRHPCGNLIEILVTKGFIMPRHHWKTLRNLKQKHKEEIVSFCSHDNHEFEYFMQQLLL